MQIEIIIFYKNLNNSNSLSLFFIFEGITFLVIQSFEILKIK